MGVVQGDQMTLNIGPQHPSTHGVLRLEVMTDGEIVSEDQTTYRLSPPLF